MPCNHTRYVLQEVACLIRKEVDAIEIRDQVDITVVFKSGPSFSSDHGNGVLPCSLGRSTIGADEVDLIVPS